MISALLQERDPWLFKLGHEMDFGIIKSAQLYNPAIYISSTKNQ